MKPTKLKPSEQKTLQAFLIALAQLETPLAEELQQDIQEIAANLETQPDEALAKIPSVVAKDSQLSHHYQTARLNLTRQYQAQERDKFAVYSFANTSTLSLENNASLADIAIEMLSSHNFQATAKQIVEQLKAREDSFIKALKMALTVADAKADIKALSVLQALEYRPLTVETLAYALEMNQEEVYQIVQNLWQERKIDTTRSSTLHKILPFLRSKKQPCIDNTSTYLSLTSLGYFYLHPVIQVA